MTALLSDHAGGGAQQVWVVFSGETDVPFLSFLSAGFRHCYVLIRDGGTWLSIDPMLNHMEVLVHHHVPAGFDLPRWLTARGQRVVAATPDRTRRAPAPWRPFTCVEAVKRILGIHHRMILTPRQLYRYLINSDTKKEK